MGWTRLQPVSNGNASETKANESFENGVFFDIEAKRTPSIVRKLFSKRSEHIRKKKIIFEAKRTRSIARKLSKRSEHVRQYENYFSKGSEHMR
jgi:hypothetical protein